MGGNLKRIASARLVHPGPGQSEERQARVRLSRQAAAQTFESVVLSSAFRRTARKSIGLAWAQDGAGSQPRPWETPGRGQGSEHVTLVSRSITGRKAHVSAIPWEAVRVNHRCLDSPSDRQTPRPGGLRSNHHKHAHSVDFEPPLTGLPSPARSRSLIPWGLVRPF